MPIPQDLEAKREELIRQFQTYREAVSTAMDDVITALNNGEYAHACSIMSTISAHQGRASVDMRAVLVKNGFMTRERDNV